MSAVEIELVGGPADGHRVVIPGDPMDPPLTTEAAELLTVDWNLLEAEDGPLFRKCLYRRAVNPLDEGPLWLYRYDAEASQ